MRTKLVSRAAQLAALIMIIMGLHAMGETEANAQAVLSAKGTITGIEAGWTDDSMAVWHSAPIVNPSNCKVANYGYATNPADPGHSLFHTVILSALLNKREVHIVVYGCIYEKPRIVGVKMLP